MKKEIIITLEDGKITFQPSKEVTNSDVLVMCVNMFEIVKENMELAIPPKEKASLADFIATVCTSLRKEDDKNEQSN